VFILIKTYNFFSKLPSLKKLAGKIFRKFCDLINTVELNPRLRTSIAEIIHICPSIKGKVIDVLEILRGPPHSLDVVPTKLFRQLIDKQALKTHT
jgi:hypothetical protein